MGKKPAEPTRVPVHPELAELPLRPLVREASLRNDTPPPRVIEEMQEVRHKQAARECWTSAVKLQAALELALHVHRCAINGTTISDEFQRCAMAMFGNVFPLNELKDLLHHIAAHPTTTRPAVVQRTGSQFPRVDCQELFAFIARLIQQFSEALVNHRVESDAFDNLESLRWGQFFLLWDWLPSGSEETHPLNIAKEFPQGEADHLFHKAAAILRRLEAGPSLVVPAPVYPDGTVPIVIPTIVTESPGLAEHVSTPSWKLRFFVDISKSTITLDKVTHMVKPAVAAWVHQLWLAEGRTVSLSKLQRQDIPSLKGKKADRLYLALPEQFRKYIQSDPGSGSKLLIDKLG